MTMTQSHEVWNIAEGWHAAAPDRKLNAWPLDRVYHAQEDIAGELKRIIFTTL